MTLADRSSNRARRSARSNAKPAPEARSVRGEVDSEERRTIHTIPVSDEGTAGSIQHPLFGILIRRFGEFLFEVDHGGKFVTAWTSRNDLLQPRRAGVFGKRPREVFGYDISRALDQIVQSVIRHKVRADYEFPIDLPGGCRWFHALAYSVGGPAKAASSMCLMARDITQRKNADFRFVEARSPPRSRRAGNPDRVLGIGREDRPARLVPAAVSPLRFGSLARCSASGINVCHDRSGGSRARP